MITPEQLRKEALAWSETTHTFSGPTVSTILSDAANEIQRLRNALGTIAEWKDVIRQLRDENSVQGCIDVIESITGHAERALKNED